MAVREQRLSAWQDTIEAQIEVRGEGPPVVFLHGPWGLRADGDFLDLLAEARTVYAPRLPGTGPGAPDDIYRLDNWLDLVIFYDELYDRLGLGSVVLVGHSFGGMLACEIAATLPNRVSKLVLLDPIGLWRDDLPVRNWMILPEEERRGALFADPDGEAARRFFGLPDAAAARAEAQASFIWSQACSGKFVWPIPDKGLRKHIHRISAPTLIVWGNQDRIIAPEYAREFAGRIADVRVELIERAGHLPHLERPAEVAGVVRSFLGDCSRAEE